MQSEKKSKSKRMETGKRDITNQRTFTTKRDTIFLKSVCYHNRHYYKPFFTEKKTH